MRFPDFEMERMQSAWEHRVRYDLSESGVEAQTLAEAARDLDALGGTRLGYASGTGRDVTRSLVAEFHEGATAENVLITTGTSEANFLALATLIEPGDEVIVVMPNYMQLHGIARGLGARVREVWLREEDGWRLDRDALRAAIGPRTKAVCVCQPNNPTGQVLTRDDVRAIVAAASAHGAWIIADEVYRGAERDENESPSFSGASDRVIVTGGLSKVYGLPGLRIGWLVAPAERVTRAWEMKDYTTIAPATLSELLAEIALSRRPALLKRARFLVNERWPILERWAATHSRALHWTEPRAGAICFFSYTWPVESIAFSDALIKGYSTMVVPGAHFSAERHLRIGFGMSPATLRSGLAAIDRLVTSLG
ncbi:MAG: aminotransferase class I/II-fold pyridoxal phosphate-dependent enzyme [Chloroflexi bacterium]|nr:aminotransferase class I/II-fold pyridoxal phosphate-dependent enzyme [Chloroflexota bacterium]